MFKQLTDEQLINTYNELVAEIKRRDLDEDLPPTIEEWIWDNWGVEYKSLSKTEKAEAKRDYEYNKKYF